MMGQCVNLSSVADFTVSHRVRDRLLSYQSFDTCENSAFADTTHDRIQKFFLLPIPYV